MVFAKICRKFVAKMLQQNQRMSVILSDYAFFKQLFRNTLIKDKGAS